MKRLPLATRSHHAVEVGAPYRQGYEKAIRDLKDSASRPWLPAISLKTLDGPTFQNELRLERTSPRRWDGIMCLEIGDIAVCPRTSVGDGEASDLSKQDGIFTEIL